MVLIKLFGWTACKTHDDLLPFGHRSSLVAIKFVCGDRDAPQSIKRQRAADHPLVSVLDYGEWLITWIRRPTDRSIDLWGHPVRKTPLKSVITAQTRERLLLDEHIKTVHGAFLGIPTTTHLIHQSLGRLLLLLLGCYHLSTERPSVHHHAPVSLHIQ